MVVFHKYFLTYRKVYTINYIIYGCKDYRVSIRSHSGVDGMWKMSNKNIKKKLLKWTYHDDSIFYLLQGDYECIYIYIIHMYILYIYILCILYT